MITPTKESLDAFRPEYEPHPVPTETAPWRRRMPRWVQVLAAIAAVGAIAVIIARAR